MEDTFAKLRRELSRRGFHPRIQWQGVESFGSRSIITVYT